MMQPSVNIPRAIALGAVFVCVAGAILWSGAYGWMAVFVAAVWLFVAFFGQLLGAWLTAGAGERAQPEGQNRRQVRLRWVSLAYAAMFLLLGLAQLGFLPQFTLFAAIGLMVVSAISIWLLVTA